MVALVENNLKEIRDVCIKNHMKTLYLSGSATQENRFSEESDADFLFQFRKEVIDLNDYADNYFDLLFYLQDILNRKVDLVAEEKMKNKYFIESINKNKLLIYES